MVEDAGILEVLEGRRGSLDAAARELVRAANRSGGEDNITVVCFELGAEGDVAPARESSPDEDTLDGAVPVVLEPSPPQEAGLAHAPVADRAAGTARRRGPDPVGGGAVSLRNRELFNLLVVGVLTGIGFASVYIARQAAGLHRVALLRALLPRPLPRGARRRPLRGPVRGPVLCLLNSLKSGWSRANSFPRCYEGSTARCGIFRIPYVARSNYFEELVIGVNPLNPVIEKLAAAYQRIALHLAALAGDEEPVRRAFAKEIDAEFPYLAESRQMSAPVPEGWIERPNETEALKRLLLERGQSPQMSRVAVWGFAGTGKTSLVAHVCRDPELISAYPHGILWLSADRHWTAEVAQQWLCNSLGLSRRVIGEGLQRAVAERHFLFVVDDVWNLDDVQELLKFGRALHPSWLLHRDPCIGFK